jgi:uncharacterized membrane protein
MNVEKHLDRWVGAGLLERRQAEEILAFEQQRPSASWVLFGLCGVGVFVLLVGIVSVIAANWDAISSGVKLGAYFVSLSLLAAATVRHSRRAGVVRETLLTAFGLYILAGIGLIAQTYHLRGDGYQALFLWVGIILPLALCMQSRLVNHLWFLGLAAAVLIWATSGRGRLDSLEYRLFVVASLPYFILGLTYGLGKALPSYFADAGKLWSYLVILIPFTIAANIGWAQGHTAVDKAGSWSLLIVAGAVVTVIASLLRKEQLGVLRALVISFTVAVSALMVIVPLISDQQGHQILGCVLFLTVWAGAAAVAASFGRKRLFDLAALAIAIRFVVVYFEVFGSLAATGSGLILSGVVILSAAWLWYRYKETLARMVQEAV